MSNSTTYKYPFAIPLPSRLPSFSEPVVYLIHLDSPLGASRHYIGWSSRWLDRINEHRRGRGSRFMGVVLERGITWRVAAFWPGDRKLERRLKRQHNGPRLCPVCKGGG